MAGKHSQFLDYLMSLVMTRIGTRSADECEDDLRAIGS